MDILRRHIISRLGNDVDNLDYVLAHFKEVTVKRNEQLLRAGDICRYVYFIAAGCLQVHVQDDE